ncbi:MAG: MFS transporter [Candidatus Bipolaricaulaceae bacterium]
MSAGGRSRFPRDRMYHKFRLYGFLKNLRLFDPFLILFFREAGLSFLQIGTLFSVREVAVNLLEVPTGVIADAFGRRRAMVGSFSAYILSFLAFYLFSGFVPYVLAMLLFACGETLRSGTHKAMILEYLRIKGIAHLKVDYYGHTRAGSQLGSAVASLIAAGLVLYAGSYRIVFLGSTVPYVLGLVLLLSYPKELDGDLGSLPGGWREVLRSRLPLTGREFLSMLRSPLTLRGLIQSAGFDGAFKGTKDYLQPILKAQALALPVFLSLSGEQRTAVVAGILYALLYLSTSVAAQSAGRLAARLPSLPRGVNLTYVGGFGLLLLAGVGAWADAYWLAIVAFVGLYLLENLRRPLLVGYLSDVIDHRLMASGLSVESQLKTIVLAALAPLVGLMADRLGVGPALMIAAGLGLAAGPALRVKGGR